MSLTKRQLRAIHANKRLDKYLKKSEEKQIYRENREKLDKVLNNFCDIEIVGDRNMRRYYCHKCKGYVEGYHHRC